MIVLGIYDDHNSSAALSIDGKVVFASQEERFSRLKNDIGFPRQTVDCILKKFKLSPSDIDEVAIAGIDRSDFQEIKYKRDTLFNIKEHIDYMEEYWEPKLAGKEYDHNYLAKVCQGNPKYNVECFYTFPDSLKELDPSHLVEEITAITRKDINAFYGIAPEKITFYDHHTCHAAYGYFSNPEPKEKTIVVTVDAFGDGRNQTVWLAEKGDLHLLAESNQCELARLYRMTTLYLGMKPLEHEYKVMGLAPYVKEKYAREVLDEFEKLLLVDGMRVVHRKRPANMFKFLQETLKYYRFDSIAGGLQAYIEKKLIQLFTNIYHETGVENFVFSGGVAMNVKANKVLANLNFVSDFFVGGSSADESLSIGACYLANITQRCKTKPLPTLYLGLQNDREEIASYITQNGLQDKYDITFDSDAEMIADLLAKGEIVARLAGQTEFGARALGNRSILANPSIPGVVKVINEMIKGRDFWMPFAASILDTFQDRYLDNPKGISSRYMATAMDTNKKYLKDIKAGTHLYDETIRPQILTKEQNPGYYNLIEKFAEKTGIGALLNTSLNLHGSPLVNDYKDAFEVFEQSGLRNIVLEGILIRKQ